MEKGSVLRRIAGVNSDERRVQLRNAYRTTGITNPEFLESFEVRNVLLCAPQSCLESLSELEARLLLAVDGLENRWVKGSFRRRLYRHNSDVDFFYDCKKL